MSSPSGIKVALLLCVALGGCSDIYFDRRDEVSIVSGEAMAANRVAQMIDPWPAASGRRNIAYNGEKAASASERYRTGCIYDLVNPITSTAYQQVPLQQKQMRCNPQPSSPASGGLIKQ